jgi:hypothetical protein
MIQTPTRAELRTYGAALAFGGLIHALPALPTINDLNNAICAAPIVTNATVAMQSHGCSDFWLNRYQTLITGLIALVAAIMTVGMVRKQMAQVERHEEQRRRREENAVRAVIPLAVSGISDYARECIARLSQIRGEEGKRVDPTGLTVPEINNDLIVSLRDGIRYADRQTATQIHEMLAWLQVQNSRLRGIASSGSDGISIIVPHNIERAILDAATLEVLASRLFQYGRGNISFHALVRPEDLRVSLFLAGVYELPRALERMLDIDQPSATENPFES